jgi:hypothetical protein
MLENPLPRGDFLGVSAVVERLLAIDQNFGIIAICGSIAKW